MADVAAARTPGALESAALAVAIAASAAPSHGPPSRCR